MKWRLKPSPKIGDRKVVVRFAWLPVELFGYPKFKVWLQRYIEVYEYRYMGQIVVGQSIVYEQPRFVWYLNERREYKKNFNNSILKF